ncbi:MAG TPA: Dam family site-specific DNA-(adenine-N6)-methyltransferase [Chitinophagales bacterium]|nr:Dam family site-specific DNA-(adenine-N6)-methyltransferase [Chitinophagales bacterium]HMW93490.1 Dam family site-specific DNA-(adenine-N6)-methyltransferase [Chitinophagales bacterium]HMZ92887.1 Dam family site-specific DNA-(adenine-N6)-methyltransferase [Chitinophagales bacterium]HNG25924.1 Dam family site-specific DNA-(adenine-N6)-methyltransferase [Chitinophagales bacterium]
MSSNIAQIEIGSLDLPRQYFPSEEITPEPFIKWAGGKQLLKQAILKQFPDDYQDYYEPFIGGGAIFFALLRGGRISDANSWLIDTYLAIRENWKEVVNILDQLPDTKEDYLKIRTINPKRLDLTTRAAYFIYLNKTCFRGLFRVNKLGQFNVPYGAYYRNYYNLENLRSVSNFLKDTTIKCCDFELAIDGITSDDFVYFDPPYYKLGGYSDFNRYTADKFSAVDHLRLASVCNELDKKGIRWMVSNSDTEFVRKLFKNYHIICLSARREINLNSSKRNVSELLILNY